MTADIKKLERHYLPQDLTISYWKTIEPYFKELLERPINSKEELEQWLKDMSEMEAALSEDVCWRQIKMTCDTANKELEESFNFFVLEIQPHIQPYAFELNKKLVNSPYINELDQEKYFTYLRSIKKSIELFREENIPIESEIAVLQQKYGMITGQMAVDVNGKTYTLQQASKFFESHDRQLREEVYKKIAERRYQDKDQLNDLFSQLVTKRNQEALNAGFENYRDFKFKQLGRFDYTKEDTFRFHESVKLHVVPLVNKIYAHKKEKLKVDTSSSMGFGSRT